MIAASQMRFTRPLLLSRHRPLVQHPHPLPDGQPDVRPVPDGRNKDLLRLTQIVAGLQQGHRYGVAR
jgi:hypothetical protein